ncbi:MAG: type II secretion system protein GspD [Candidatus Woesearchaeota archaeon]
MKKLINKYYIITILVLLLPFFFSSAVSAETAQIDDINFKNADVQEVLRSIAKIFDKNVVLDNSVSGDITITLEKVGFEEALKLITNAKDLSYKEDKNTIFVASPERIESLYDSQETNIINLKTLNSSEAKETINNIYDNLRVSTLPNEDQLLIKGNKEEINKAVDLFKKIDKENEEKSESKKNYEIIDIESNNYSLISDSLKSIYPDLELITGDNKNKIVLFGEKAKISEAKEIIDRLDVKKASESNDEEKESEDMEINVTKRNTIDYIPIEDIEKIIEDNFSDLNISKNPQFKEVILKGESSKVDEAISFLEEIDRPQRQVMIEVRVEEISRSDVEELGLNSLNEENEESDSSFPKISFVKEEEVLEAVNLEWSGVFDYLNRNSKSETLANPHLITLNGKEGRLLIGDRIPVKTSEGEGGESIDYIEAGINLSFEPWISQDDIIRLEVQPEVSSLGEEKYEGYPTIQTREVETTLNLKDGETFVIGGLIQEEDKISESKIPYLSEMPILGKLFSRENEDKSRTELLIFITPKIINNYENEDTEGEYDDLNN